jgi:hypothetical protein
MQGLLRALGATRTYCRNQSASRAVWVTLSFCGASSGLQRTEFYSGTDLFITKPDMSYTIVPTGIAVTSCFQEGGATSPTPLLPANTSGFAYSGDAVLSGKAVHRYQLKTVKFNRTSTYTLSVLASDNLTPVMYEMQGYDSLLGSHFDQYVITYSLAGFGPASGSGNASLYQPPAGIACSPMENGSGMRGDGNPVTGGMSNPLAVFAEAMLVGVAPPANGTCATHSAHPQFQVQCAYERFLERHAGSAGAGSGAGAAGGRFRRSSHFVEARNRLARASGSGFRVALNRFADWTDAEMLASQGGVRRRDLPADSPLRRSVALQNDTATTPPLFAHAAPGSPDVSPQQRGQPRRAQGPTGALRGGIPASFSWEQEGAVEPPPDQAICGSCWAHGAAGTIASSVFLKTGSLLPHSRQQLMDCSWKQGNAACDGGFDYSGYQWIMTQQTAGLATQSSYGPYLGQDGKCHTNDLSVLATLKGYVNVTSGDEAALLDAIVNVGPISISIDAALPDFTFYSSGVYDNPACKNDIDDLDHTVLLVGYGTDAAGKDFYLVRNSWSTYWGSSGYIQIARKGNICGVATQPTYVILE